MQDRVSLYPGRVKLVPVAGQENTYDMVRADSPTQEGTPLDKANLLSDDAEVALFGVANDRTVSEAFAGIGAKLKLIMSDMASITVTVTDQAGNAVKNALVDGIYSDSGSAVYTNASGVASGYISEGNQIISVKNYADLEDISKTLTVVKGATIVETLTPTRRNFLKLTSSKNVKFSGDVSTIDISVVGGGGGGSSGYGRTKSDEDDYTSGSGGGGGYCINSDGIEVSPNVNYPAVIGAGGKGSNGSASPAFVGEAGGDGGASSFMGITAQGGKGGAAADGGGGVGNGNGGTGRSSLGAGTAGSDGSTLGYSSFTETVKFGGGGGGGYAGYAGNGVFGGNGGDDFGGKGGGYSEDTPSVTAGTGGGGGGGGAYVHGRPSAAGGSGCVTMRIHFGFGDLSA